MEKEEVFKYLTIRPAHKEDKGDIIGINNNVYDGIDYLPEFIDKFLSCSSFKCYVALYKDTVVGFCAEQLVDGGYSGIIRAARVHSSMTGKGVYKKLTEFAQNQSLCKIHAFTTSNINPAINRNMFQRQHVFLGQRDIHTYTTDCKTMGVKINQQPENRKVTETDASIVRNFLSSPNTLAYLFPHERIIINWVPFQLTEINIPLLDWHNSVFYSNVAEQANGVVTGLLSVSSTFKTQDPSITCMLDIYGTDSGSIETHVKSQLAKISKTFSGSVALLVFTDQSVGRELMDNALSGFGISKSDESMQWVKMTTQVLYEKTIN